MAEEIGPAVLDGAVAESIHADEEPGHDFVERAGALVRRLPPRRVLRGGGGSPGGIFSMARHELRERRVSARVRRPRVAQNEWVRLSRAWHGSASKPFPHLRAFYLFFRCSLSGLGGGRQGCWIPIEAGVHVFCGLARRCSGQTAIAYWAVLRHEVVRDGPGQLIITAVGACFFLQSRLFLHVAHSAVFLSSHFVHVQLLIEILKVSRVAVRFRFLQRRGWEQSAGVLVIT